MLVDVWPCLNFWFCLAIISSPLWVLSFVFMDFIQKTSGLGFIFLCLAPALLCFAGDLVLWYFYLHPPTNRFFRKYERTGSSIGAVLLVLGNVGLRCFPEKSVACCLTFLLLAFYYLCALFSIQPYTGFGALEFLLSASVNVAFDRFGLHKPYPWLVVVLCIVIFGIRYGLRPHHPREQLTGEEVDFGQLEAGVSTPITNNEDPSHLLGAQLDNNSSPSDIFREPAPAGGPTTPLLQQDANERRTWPFVNKPVREFVDQRTVPPLLLDPIIKPLAIKVRDCYPAHDHELELKPFNKQFTCSRCMEDGFTSGYRCKLCVYDIHKECMNPKPKITHKLFPGSVFEFRQKPHINRSICDACGMIINGCSYRCEARNLDLHPRCSNLQGKLCIYGTDFVLVCKNVEQRCFSCKMKLHSRLTEENVPGWCYVSERNKFYFHVYCVSQMVQEAWRRADLDLHPRCSNLPGKLRIDGTDFSLVEDEEEEENPPKNDNQEMQIVNKPIREFVDQRKVASLLPDPIIKQLAIKVSDCYPAHDHELELKSFDKPFT